MRFRAEDRSLRVTSTKRKSNSATIQMPRLVRRQPLLERIKAYLNPLDFLLWASEELESNDWNEVQKIYATPLGLVLNAAFLIARANSGDGIAVQEDVFSDGNEGSGWLLWLASFTVHSLTLLSLTNAIYTFYRTRHYRLFEVSVDAVPSTPSAQRVRVDSSPMASSPLRFLSGIIAGTTAESRSHPDNSRDVWEVAVWDPTPLSLRLFCLFSPGHVLVYFLFLPTPLYDSRPSTTVFTTIILGVLLSVQLVLLQSSFSQQSKDTALIHKEVLHEYDTKFVHPRTNQPVRDVGTQCYSVKDSDNFVQSYTPTTVLNRGFRTKPNTNYSKHYDPEGLEKTAAPPSVLRGIPLVPNPPFQTPQHLRDASSPLRPTTAIRQPQFRSSTTDGGSLGVFTHANSPLKKSTGNQASGPDGYISSRSPVKRVTSPLKRTSLPGGGASALLGAPKFGHISATPRRESGRF